MSRTGLTRGAGTYRCPHCGSLYAVTVRHRVAPKADSAVCDVCRKTMTSWLSTLAPEHRLLKAASVPIRVAAEPEPAAAAGFGKRSQG